MRLPNHYHYERIDHWHRPPGRSQLLLFSEHHAYKLDKNGKKPGQAQIVLDQPHCDAHLEDQRAGPTLLKVFPEIHEVLSEISGKDNFYIRKLLGRLRRIEQDCGIRECMEILIPLLIQYYEQAIKTLSAISSVQKSVIEEIDTLRISWIQTERMERSFLDQNRQLGFNNLENFPQTLEQDIYAIRNFLPFGQLPPELLQTFVIAHRRYGEAQDRIFSHLDPKGIGIPLHSMRGWNTQKPPLDATVAGAERYIETLRAFETTEDGGFTKKAHAVRRDDVGLICSFTADYPEQEIRQGYDPTDRELAERVKTRLNNNGIKTSIDKIYSQIPTARCTQKSLDHPDQLFIPDLNIATISRGSEHNLDMRPEIDHRKIHFIMNIIASEVVNRIFEKKGFTVNL